MIKENMVKTVHRKFNTDDYSIRNISNTVFTSRHYPFGLKAKQSTWTHGKNSNKQVNVNLKKAVAK